MSSSDSWIRVTREMPCPVCGKPDNCTVSSDGTMVWCGRVSDGSLSQNKGGQYLHRIRDDWRQMPLAPVHKPRPKPRHTDYSGLASRLAAEGCEGRERLAELLGVKVSALERLGVGWDGWKHYWSFPERDAAGRIIGINERHSDGDKRRRSGSRAGLTYADGWDNGDGPVLLVEGGSDTAALLGIGLNVIGRPSNLGGVSLLAELLNDWPDDREIIVIGERDQKPDGRWPGREGAISTAEGLSEKLDRVVLWSLPPDHAKDSRAWLNSMPLLPDERLRALYVSGLETFVIDPPLLYPCPRIIAPTVVLADWRDAMLQSRIEAMNHPGCYLDGSITGAGKSHVDRTTLMRVFSSEAA